MYLKIFVTPSAKREKIEVVNTGKGGKKADVLAIAVKEPAIGNRANTRVREIVAERMGKLLGQVRILTGHHSRSKILSISD